MLHSRRSSSRSVKRSVLTRAALETLERRQLLAVSSIVAPGPDGRLIYTPTALGDRVEDFSSAGYKRGEVPLPNTAGGVTVPVKITLNPGAPGVDMTTTIQNAINSVGAMSIDANGFRGAVMLNAGNYPISGQLLMTFSGVVLEGAGDDPVTGTRLEGTGTSTRTLISLKGSGSRSTVSNTTHNITDNYVPVGATSFTLDSVANLHVGDTIIVHRPSTTQWIHDIGMDTLTSPWTAGSRDLDWDRKITAINGNTITIDVPLTNSIDKINYGQGTMHAYTWTGRINQTGLMNVYAYSDFSGASDTDTAHASGVLSMDMVQDAWVYNITADNFATNIVTIGGGAKSVTFDHDVLQNTSQAASNIADAPSGILTSGEEILVSNTALHSAFHAIAIGANVPGPSVYTNITIDNPADDPLNLPHSRQETGPHQRWSTGGLFDVVTSSDWINIRNAGNEGSGHGWQGANYVLWNVNAKVDASSPPTAQNWVIGGTGTRQGTATFDQSGSTVTPASLYTKQLWDRLHPNPTIVTPAAANPNPLNGSTSVALSVLGAESGLAESNLTYTWATLSKPAGAANPSFSAGNGTNAGKNLTATLSQVGTYIFTITIQDPGGLNAVGTVVVTPAAGTPISGNQLRIVRNGTFVDVYQNGGASPVLHQDYATSPELILQGTSGNGDVITIDYSGGNPVPAAGLVVDGDGGSGDIVSVIGGAGSDAVTLTSGGGISDNGGQFGYSDFDELDLGLGAGSDTVTASGNSSVSATALQLNLAGGGSVAMTGSSTLPTFADLTVNAATFDLNGQPQSIDSITGGGTILNNGAATTLTVNSGNLTGILKDGSGVLSLTKVSGGTLTLSGNNAYTGLTTLSGGVMASGNSVSLVALAGTIMFNGGTLHVTANSTANNVANKFNTNTGFAGAGGTIDIDAGVTLTIGTVGGSANLRTNGGGFHGGTFTKTGLGTLRILSNNGQLDDPFKLNAGTVSVESATGLGGADSSTNHVDMKSGTTLILRQDAATNFLTPISIVDANAMINVIIDRASLGAGVTHSLNALTSAGAFALNLSAGSNISGGGAGLSFGSVTLSGNGTFNISSGVALNVTSAFAAGAFTLTKSGVGTMSLQINLATATAISISAGVLQLAPLGTRVIKTPSLSIAGTGQLDLQDNKLIISTAGQTGNLAGLIQKGRNGGAWNGAGGIVTRMPGALAGNFNTLAVAKAGDVRNIADSATTLFAGQVVSGSDTLVMFTYAGDANLDGTINIDDYTRIDTGIAAASNGWSNGDFNYDGKINIDDYVVIDANISQQGPPFTTASAASALTDLAAVTKATPKRTTRAIR